MKLLIVLLLIVSLRISVLGGEKDLIFERISPEAGFAFDAIVSIAEDENGFIWFGCNSGLYYYNSVDVTRYDFDPLNADTPPSNKINKLYLGLDNRLWACTDNGICYFDKFTNSFKRIDLKGTESFRKFNNVTYLVQLSDTDYLIVLNNALYSFNIDNLILKPINIENGLQSSITFLERGEDNNVYIGTSLGQIYKKEADQPDFKFFHQSIPSAVASICAINSDIWIGYKTDGVSKVNSEGELVSRYSQESSGNKLLPSNRIQKIVKRKNGEIWIATFKGIFIIDQTETYTITQNSHNKLPHNTIYELCIDKNDGIWAGTWSGGLVYYNDLNYRFLHIQRLNEIQPNSRTVVSSFAESSDGKVWVGTEQLGLNEYELKTMTISYNPQNVNNKPYIHIKSMATDNSGKIWIGTFYQDLWFIDKNSKQLKKSETNIDGIVSSITPSTEGLWLGTRGAGLFLYKPEKNTTENFLYDELKIRSISSDMIWMTYLDSKENLWICTDFGLSLKEKGSTEFKRFFQNENAGSLSRNVVYSICEDNTGKLWIGTSGGGIDIYDPKDQDIHKLNLNNTLNTADIYSIIKDHNNNMWLSTNKGIHVYYTATNKLKSFSEIDGLQGNQYNPHSAFINSEGILFFGGSNGFNVIDPNTVKENPIAPQIFISKLLINNVPIPETKIRYINSLHLENINTIELNYNENSLNFDFAANNFIKSSKNKFSYRLKNYQDEWAETTTGKNVSFTKIPSGSYILEVLGANNDGIWSTVPKQIFIRIYPPIWLAWYAYLLYFLIISVVLFLISKELIYRAQAKKEIVNERYKREASEMLSSEKTKFFTNVSHEFRTPLTLIISPLNNLLKKFQNDQGTMEHLKTIKRNSERLLRLTNQMLDFRLIELGKIKIKPAEKDIVNLCKDICDCFDYIIIEKNINFIFSSAFKSFNLPIDSDMIEKVVYNLLSNALKFSPDKSQIILSVEQKILNEDSYFGYYCTGNSFVGNSLEIKVRDYGIGIDPNVIPKIFDRFYMDAKNQETGTGIGLHICQEYISLHSGNILVASEVEGGTTFMINLPLSNNVIFEKENTITQLHFDKLTDPIIQNTSDFNPAFLNKVILIAEDNDELRIYLKNFLMGGFKVLTAKNGNQAFEIAMEVVPDLIISDVLMPGMDGLELTSQIRKNKNTNHIPIILLTALSENKVQIDSMNRGADLFLTKPIDESLLLAQIDNILVKQENLIHKFGSNASETGQSGDKSLKLSFIEQAEKYIFENIRNEQLDINMLASELNISRSSLHRKIKTHANQSATEFIRDIRLKNAIRMMSEKIYNMDEIALLVGFNSTSYFNRSFKQKYGKTPKEYQNEMKKN